VTKTPVHMRARHHTMGAIGLVIRLHVGTMWLPSLITGLIVDRIGPRLMTGTYRMTCIYPWTMWLWKPIRSTNNGR